jgi:hypothetical protein
MALVGHPLGPNPFFFGGGGGRGLALGGGRTIPKAMGVASATSKGRLGVAEATPMSQLGWLANPLFLFLFLFFKKIKSISK